MTPAVIRQVAGEDDLEAACQLLQQFFREEQFDTPPETVAAHARRMYELQDHCLMLLAWAEGLPVAVANRLVSNPNRCSTETKRFGRG